MTNQVNIIFRFEIIPPVENTQNKQVKLNIKWIYYHLITVCSLVML